MAKKREKTVSYRRAEWFVDHPESINLGMCIKEALKVRTTVSERTFSRGEDQFVRLLSHHSDDHKGHYLHLTTDTPGEAASVVPTAATRVDEILVSTTAPPDDAEFMDGDAFVYVRGNDVCLCGTAMTDDGVWFYLKRLFEAASIRQDSGKFILAPVANVDKVDLIRREGVSEVELSATIYKATADYARRNGKPAGLLSNDAREFKVVLGLGNDANEDGLRVMLNLRVDNRRRGMELGEKRLQALAIETINDAKAHDKFIIVTKRGQRISSDEVYMKKTVYIDRLGKSVECDEAWSQLTSFYNDLESSGALEM